MENSIQFLKKVELFSLLSEEEISMIIDNFNIIDFEENQVLFREGEEGSEMFIVRNGSVKPSFRLPEGNEREMAVFGKGDFFGEMSIFDNSPRSATCTVMEPTQLLSLKESDLLSMIQKNPEIAIKIMYRMLNITTRRLKDNGEFLSDMVQWGESARKRTITDEFTGVYNRRFLDDALPEFFDDARRSSQPLSLVMVDLDYFREINDTYGYETGNRVILGVVSVVKKHLRNNDILARYGGDEFTLLLPETGINEAMILSEKIRRDVEHLAILGDGNAGAVKITATLGLATYPENALTLETLKSMADQALYRAKESGRNRIYCIVNKR